MSRRWLEQRERGSLFAIRIILWIALNLGRRTARLFLVPITAYFFLFASEARQASAMYLRRALNRTPRRRDVWRHIHTFAATILDRAYFLAGRHEGFDIRVHNPELITDQVASGQGCLLLGAHFGSFEVLRTLAVDEQRLPLKVLMRREHNAVMTRLLDQLNPGVSETVIPLGGPTSLLQVNEALERGEMVGILGDRLVENGKVVHCRFFGESAAFPAGPVLLASSLRVPVILFFGIYRGGNRYDVHFELLARGISIPRERREAGLREWTQEYAAKLEAYAREAPYNWFNFYDYWDEKPAA